MNHYLFQCPKCTLEVEVYQDDLDHIFPGAEHLDCDECGIMMNKIFMSDVDFVINPPYNQSKKAT